MIGCVSMQETPIYPDLFLRNALGTLFKRLVLLSQNFQRNNFTYLHYRASKVVFKNIYWCGVELIYWWDKALFFPSYLRKPTCGQEFLLFIRFRRVKMPPSAPSLTNVCFSLFFICISIIGVRVVGVAKNTE